VSIRWLLFDISIIVCILAFLLTFFDPKLLFTKTITAGGDTASHYYTAVYLRDFLLPQGKIMGWLMANYAGFPLFYHYFPLPFIFMALLGYIVPLEISFKLITVSGTFLLPLSVYLMFRLMGYQHPIPIIGAIMSLAFLFNENNSMWGGNIPSTLAGEFSFSISLSLFVILIGTFYRGIHKEKYIIPNALLFSLMCLSHGYSTMLFLCISSFFLLRREFLKNLWYMLRVYILGGMLMAFWFIPFVDNLAWVTPFKIKWYFHSIWEIFPPILIPFFAISFLGLLLNSDDRRTRFFVFILGLTVLLYFVAYYIGLVDVRFLTFAQFLMTILGAISINGILRDIKCPSLIPVILLLATFLWTKENTRVITNWVDWNYSGFEKKQKWHDAKALFDYLRDGNDTGRVVYENSILYEEFGTQRIFESLRMFSGRDTLEGLYIQSSITSPFVFYIQSEISKDVSAPLWDYSVSDLDLKMGLKHLQMFNVSQFIVRSNKVKKAIREIRGFVFEGSFGELELYRVVNPEPRYVVPARFEPVAYTKKTWKRDFYEWFKNREALDIPVVYVADKEAGMFQVKTEDATRPPRVPLHLPSYTIKEKIGEESIEFETTLITHPHIIRVSYHPNWKVEGARGPYLVAPSFMLVYPTENNVRLTFSKGYIGEGITVIGIIVIIGYLVYRRGQA